MHLPCNLPVAVPGHGRSIEEAEYALCCQSNQALEKTEVGVPIINMNISE